MSDNSAKNGNVRNDEIDLIDLFRRMGRTLNRWTKSLGRGFLISVVFMLKHWLPLGVSIVLAIGATYLFRTTSDSFFTSDLVLRTNSYIYQVKPNLSKPNLITASDLIAYINRLQTYSRQRNIQALANAISTSMEQARDIVDISAYWIIDKGPDGNPDFVDYSNSQSVYDTVNVRMQDRLDVRVRIKSPQELKIVRDGIIKFINSDSLFQQRNRIRLRQNNELISRLKYDIIQLDSLQKVKYFEETRNKIPKAGGQTIFLQEQKTQLVYDDIYSLYSRKQALESENDLYKDIVTILSDFSVPAKRDNGGMYYGKYLIPSFFIFTLLLLIIISNRNKLKELFEKY